MPGPVAIVTRLSDYSSSNISLEIGLAVTVFLFFAYTLCRRIFQRLCRSRKLRRLNCTTAKAYPHRELWLGLDLLWICTKALSSHHFLATAQGILSKHGRTLEYLVLGNKAMFTSDPENIKTVLSTNFDDYGLGPIRKGAMNPLLGRGIFNIDGPAWRHSRLLLRPHVARRRDADLDVFERHTQRLLQVLLASSGEVDLQMHFDRLALDIATEIFTGRSTDCLLPGALGQSGREFAAAFEHAQNSLCEIGRINIWCLIASLFGNRKLKQSLRVVDQYMQTTVMAAFTAAQRLSDKGETTFLESLTKEAIDVDQIKKEVLNLLVAGKDTIKTLLSNVWFVLARHPEVWQQLQDEIGVLDGQKPTRMQLSALRYLNQVINETLRLYPPVPLNQRTAEVDTVLPHGGGSDGLSPVLVEKGVSVAFNIYAMHRSQDYFGPDAESFRPGRWETTKPPVWAFLPFNGGPRTCLGQQFAHSEVSYVTVRLLQHFSRIESRDFRPWEESISLNTCSRNGVKVVLVPITTGTLSPVPKPLLQTLAETRSTFSGTIDKDKLHTPISPSRRTIRSLVNHGIFTVLAPLLSHVSSQSSLAV